MSCVSEGSYDGSMALKPHYEWEEVDELLAGGEPTTPDDVSITDEGRRLDSAAAAREFFDVLRADRERRGRAS